MSEEQGKSGLERRTAERVELEAQIRWRRLGDCEADALLHKGAYSELADAFFDPDASPTEEALERRAYTENLSLTGLKLVGDLRLDDGSSLRKGWELLVEIAAPDQDGPIRALAEVMWITPSSEAPRQAGLFFKAVNKEDVERVLREAAAKGAKRV